MATTAAPASSSNPGRLQTVAASLSARVERRLEAERDQLVLWLPVAIGTGITAWFVLPGAAEWGAAALLLAAAALVGIALGQGGRAWRVVAIAALAALVGLGLGWAKAARVAAPVLARPMVAAITATVERADALPARDMVRLRLTAIDWPADRAGPLPARVRVNLAARDAPAGIAPGARVRFPVRLMPPPSPAVPGAYDFARVAWFDGIGATGRGFAPVDLLSGAGGGQGLRARLSDHIHARLPGSAGGIAAALATGDTGGIAESDQEAMRRSGLAHLLSVSGLHITAAVGLTMLAAMRLLALSRRLALTGRMPLIAAGVAAATAVGYTLLTGSEVPTIRSCVAALLVLVALAAGREAITLRLVAAGAVIVLLAWPESLAGPSFQLSFAAVTAIVALHEHPRVRSWFAPRDEGVAARLGRGLGSLLLTGVAVELALTPIAVFHFHKTGLYGALANIVAIPLTTFVIMPIEALALALDGIGIGRPAWWAAGQGLDLLLWIARTVAAAPGSVTAIPAMPHGAFALMAAGGLWLALWRTGWRHWGLVPVAAGAAWALATPAPDLLVTGDGRHLAIRTATGDLALLRDRAGDYTRATLAENGGIDAEPLALADQPDARCSRDLCLVERAVKNRRWRILATRSAYLVPAGELIAACRAADVVVSERRLPRACTPRWLRLDRPTLARTGGVAVTLATGHVTTVRQAYDRHPWVAAGAPRAASPERFRQRYPTRRSDTVPPADKQPRARPQS